MVFIFNANGTLCNSIPESIYLGSNEANKIIILAPWAEGTKVYMSYQLPNSIYTTPTIMTLFDTYPMPQDFRGNAWSIDVDEIMTENPGQINIQFFALIQGSVAPSATATVTGTGITSATVDASTFASVVNASGSYDFNFDGTNWTLSGTTISLATYGITPVGTAVSGDKITISYNQGTIRRQGTAQVSFMVEVGNPVILPATPTQTIYDQILAAIADLELKAVAGYFKSKSILSNSTYSYGMNEVVYNSANNQWYKSLINNNSMADIADATKWQNLDFITAAQVDTKISTHNSSNDAHPFILNRISTAIAAHNISLSAHGDIRAAISAINSKLIDRNDVTEDNLSIIEGDNKIATENYVNTQIADIKSIKIRNKEPNVVITSTEAQVQTTATQYMVDNYSRQPENFDALIITITDKSNDKILYVYSSTSSLWINVGINSVDLSNYTTLNTQQTLTGEKNFTGGLYKDSVEVATVESDLSSITNLNITTGQEVVTYDTTDGITINSNSSVSYGDSSTQTFESEFNIPIKCDDGSITMDADQAGEWILIKGEHIQRSTMPTASAEFVNKPVQYIGQTTANYTHDYFYECVNNVVQESITAVENDNLNTLGAITIDTAVLKTKLAPGTHTFHKYGYPKKIRYSSLSVPMTIVNLTRDTVFDNNVLHTYSWVDENNNYYVTDTLRPTATTKLYTYDIQTGTGTDTGYTLIATVERDLLLGYWTLETANGTIDAEPLDYGLQMTTGGFPGNEILVTYVAASNTYEWQRKDVQPETEIPTMQIVSTNISVSNWEADTTYADFGYKADITVNGITSSWVADVMFGQTEATSGNYANVSLTGTNTVTIYSKVNTTITIPTIICFKGGN